MSKIKYGYDHTTGEGQKRLMYESAGHLINLNYINTIYDGDYGSDPLGNGKFKMIPSGDIVDLEERNKRMKKYKETF